MTRSQVVLDSFEAIHRHLDADIEPEGFCGNGVRFVLCDDRNRVMAHIHVGDVPAVISEGECRQTMSLFVHELNVRPDSALLIALCRPGMPVVTAADRIWFRVAHRLCARHNIRLLGVHIVTPRGQRPVVLDDAL